MKQTFTLKEKTKQILILLIPILITQLSMFSMVFFNTMMSGRYDSADLAGVAIGASIWNPVFIGLSGILLAVSPIAAQKIGEKNNIEVTAIVKNGLVLSVLIALIVIIAGILLLNPLLSIMGIEGRVYEIAFHYLSGLSIGIFPLFA
ncbi:MATE family efflux transporter, partial [Bacillus sp. CRN 9]|nr:MATE family efflux transporter [Bacillus sp. CRN 9]